MTSLMINHPINSMASSVIRTLSQSQHMQLPMLRPTRMHALAIKSDLEIMRQQMVVVDDDESYAMKGGEGPHSYAKNSIIQKGLIDGSKRLIHEAISQSFDPKEHVHGNDEPSKPICIADLGCSTGPNTFFAMQTITEAIQQQFQSHGLASQIPDIQVLFNDQVSNDFNTLFKNLPQQRIYYATAVPGSFCGRLFPKQALHLVHSSAALCWLSKLPSEITDPDSSACNKGRIHYTDAPKEVAEAYATQYSKDMGNFLHARAQELVENGLMLLQFPVSNVLLDSDVDPAKVFELIGTCLVDMAKVGVISEEKVDSFNVPLIYPSVKAVKEILRGCDECFSIEWMEILEFKNMVSLPTVQIFISWFRAALQGMIEKHFGAEIVDELFERFAEKVKEFPDIMDTDKLKLDVLFVLLRRKNKPRP
ncbi:hypothetical protein HN51_029392 [Arachis hypogaea]|uniref:S-adenosylmethionine-dependent methyltransferase n=1 Tax=Arachis hypogaea TaxID=3818 RepID=A0A445BEX4_ARAHY|nr:probable S-adenosylmethionine-dependent methyltransferase At5g37990 [Arachis hypogaea]QHO36012.1 putative S-adenosylmethionine-dependent methyltransferase [Arachis hypogaea]RYR37206.1 hypothetical protein Ahy_A09g042127 [Arachis hypogaea]